jgi:hypothetical protein
MGGSGPRGGIGDRIEATLEHMDQEVAKTLSELELKLQELERELTSIGHRDTPRHQDNPPAEQPRTPGMLIDEAVERQRRQESDAQELTAEEAIADDDGFGGPAVWGGEEVPAQAGATVERDWSVEVRETAYGEIPIPPPRAPDSSQAPWPPAPAPLHVSPPSYVSAPPQTHSPSHVPPPPPAVPLAHHPYASTPSERESIDVAELVQFKHKLQRTLDELIAEYSRLLSPKPPA